MSGRLDGRIALVTGGGRGIGAAISRRFAREGAAVVVNYTTRADAAEAVVADIRQAGGRALAIRADVSDASQVKAMVAQAIAAFDRIDILVNNAGVLFRGTALSTDDDEFDRMLDVNVKGVVRCVRAVAPGMIERRRGRIVNISSLAGLGTAAAETTPYAATKAAVVALTKRQALELGPHGITVNAICPGYVRTEMLEGLDSPENRGRLEAMNQKAMLGRIGAPDDIANAALFLASDDASFITAQAIAVDGGRMDFLTHSA